MKKVNKKTFAFSVVFLLAFAAALLLPLFGFSNKTQSLYEKIKSAYADETPVFGDGSFTYSGENISGVNIYGGCSLTALTEAEAKAAGVPSGYKGSVLKAQNAAADNAFDLSFDFTAAGYSRSAIKSLSFRIYIVKTSADNAKYPEVRIPVPGQGDTWLLGGGLGANKTDEWITITLNDSQLDRLCVDGYLKQFAFCVRLSARTVVYFDEVTVEIEQPDLEPPVIDLPVTEFTVEEGTYPLDDTAVISDDSGSFTVDYEWSDGALDRFGRLTCGEHTCKITATDKSGKSASATVKYTVIKATEIKKCKITFKCEGIADKTIEYYADEIYYRAEDFLPPEAPEKPHYIGKWESYELGKSGEQIVNYVYYPIAYTVTFVVDGKEYKKCTYAANNVRIDEPAVPEKAGYTGKWSSYELDFSDVTVEAVYTKSQQPSSGSGSSSSPAGGSQGSNGTQSCSGCNSSFLFDLPCAAVMLLLFAFVALRKKHNG